MNTLIGLLIIAVGSFGQSSSYVPINKVKGWSWENFWLVQGIFAWLVFPLLGALLAIPADGSLIELWGSRWCIAGYYLRCPLGCRRSDIRIEYALFGRCFRTKYSFGYLCRFRNPVSGSVCRERFAAR